MPASLLGAAGGRRGVSAPRGSAGGAAGAGVGGSHGELEEVNSDRRTEKYLPDLVKRLLGFEGPFLVKWRLWVESEVRNEGNKLCGSRSSSGPGGRRRGL